MAANTDNDELNKNKTTLKPTKGKVKVDLEPQLNVSLYEAFASVVLEGDDSDFYDHVDLIDEGFAEFVLAEAILSVSARMRKRAVMRRYKNKIAMARKRQMHRTAGASRLKSRARRSAVQNVKRRFSTNKSMKNLSYGERARLEKIAASRKSMITRQARRLVNQKRTLDRSRMRSKPRK